MVSQLQNNSRNGRRANRKDQQQRQIILIPYRVQKLHILWYSLRFLLLRAQTSNDNYYSNILWCEEHSKICVCNVFVRSIENQNTCRHSSKIQKHLSKLIHDWKKHIWKSTLEHYFNWWLFHHTFVGSNLFWNVHLIKPSVIRKNNCVVTSQDTIDRDAKINTWMNTNYNHFI